MTVPKFNPNWVYGACLALWTLYLLIIATPDLLGGTIAGGLWLPIIFHYAGLLSVVSLVLLILGVQSPKAKQRALSAKPANKTILRTMAGLLAVCLIVSTYCTIHCLSIDASAGKFVYENVATGTSFVALVLIFILSRLQNDAFWVSRSRSMQLDELQLRERHATFELSYKIAAWMVAITAIVLYSNAHAIYNVFVDPEGFRTTPSAVFLPLGNLALALFALPLVLAPFSGTPGKKHKR